MVVTAAPSPRLVFCPHPILAAAGRQVVTAEFLPGESIQAYLDRQGVVLGHHPWALEVDGHPVPREWWDRVRPKPGTLITLRALVHGGGGGEKNPLQTILSIALMVVSGPLGSALGASLGYTGTAFTVFGQAVTWGGVFGGLISLGGSMLISALTQPSAPQLSQANGAGISEAVSPTYALAGGSNRTRLFEPMPLVVGRHRVFPDNGAKFYTEFEGEDQYLYQIFNFGIGTPDDLLLSDWKIGDTSLASFEGVELFEAGADGALPDMPGNVDTATGGALTEAAGWIARTGSPNATAIAVDLQGQLYQISDSGSMATLTCNIEAEYRLVGAGSWTAWKNETLSSASRKPIRVTWRESVTSGQYEVRLRRVTADSTSPRQVSDFALVQLKTYQPDEADYTGQRRVGVKIKASGQLQGRVDSFNAVASRKVSVWTGSAWSTEESDNPAWLTLWFARGGSVGGRPAFGVGLADARIDIDGLKEWGAWCDAKGLGFNAVFDSARSRASILDTIARCGRGSPSWAKGTLGVVWDQADLPHVAVFGMHNIAAGTFEVDYSTEALADEVALSFINPDENWQQDQVRVVVPGFAPGYVPQRPVTVELFGCTDKTQAGKEANLIAASQRYHRRRVRWQASFEGLVAQRGDVVVLAHDLTQWGASGRLTAATDTVLELDRAVSYASGSPYVMVTSPAGESEIRAVVPFAGESDTLTLTAALPWNPGADADNPVMDYSFVFDPLPTPGRRVKIVGVPKIAGGGRRVQYEAVDDEADYYASESGAFTWTPPGSLLPPAPTVGNLTVFEELIRAGSGYAVRLHVTWTVAGAYDHAAVLVGEGALAPTFHGTATGAAYDLTVPDAGQTVTIRVVVLDAAGRSDEAAGSASIVHSVLGKAAAPGNVANFRISGDLLSWDAVADVDLAGYVLRWQPGDLVHWGTAQPLHTGLITASPFTMTWRPVGATTLLIKAVDTSGNESGTAAAIYTDLGDIAIDNVVAAQDYHATGFPGTITAGAVDGSTGDLLADVDASPAAWTADSDPAWTDDADPAWDADTYAAMTFEAEFNVVAIDAGSRMSTLAEVAAATWAMDYRIAAPIPAWTSDSDPAWTSDSDPAWDDPEWGDWRPWPGSVVADEASYGIRLTTAGGAVQGRVSALAMQIDVPDVVERIDDFGVDAAGSRLPITKTFRAIRNVSLTLQADAGGAISVKTLDKSATLGPLVRCFDIAGVGATGTIDAIIQGY